jgi:predicted metal-binding membrane protein
MPKGAHASFVSPRVGEPDVFSIVPSMASPAVGAVLLLIAGVYQLTPTKQACLRTCQSPLGFLMSRWRSGLSGAFAMGLEHGAYCVGAFGR